MKYSIQVLQAEVARFENGITFFKKGTKDLKESEKTARKREIEKWEKQITELKADIKKL